MFASLAAIAVLIALTGAAAAQSPPPPSGEETLKRLIDEYETQRHSIERPLLVAYAQRLTSLKDSLEKRRDPAAAEVAAELGTVQAVLATSSGASAFVPRLALAAPPTTPVELPGKSARTSGDATVIGDGESPVHFAGKDSAAEWTLPKLPAGRYRLLWSIACEVGAGATVRLSIDGQQPRTLEVLPTSASGDPLVANLGEFTATTAPAWVRVEVLSLPGDGRPRKVGPSFSIQKVILVPPGVAMPDQ